MLLESKDHKSVGSLMGRFPCHGLCCTETKSLKLKYGTNFLKNTTHGARTHLSFSALPSVSVESILQRECERSVRDVGVGSAKTGTLEGRIFTGDCDCMAKQTCFYHLKSLWYQIIRHAFCFLPLTIVFMINYSADYFHD